MWLNSWDAALGSRTYDFGRMSDILSWMRYILRGWSACGFICANVATYVISTLRGMVTPPVTTFNEYFDVMLECRLENGA